MLESKRLSGQLLKSLFICIAILFFVINGHAHAAFTLSVSPLDGGSSLRFGRVSKQISSSQEVRVRVNSTETTQYQVFQRIVDPFYNEKGMQLAPQAFKTYAITGSNASGTLYQQDILSMGFADQLIYTSSSNGLSDSFTLVYTIDPEFINTDGNFFGKIMYTLRPVGGGAQEEVFLNVYFDIADEFTLITDASSGKSLVRLSSDGIRDQEGFVRIAFSGNLGNDLEIYQEIDALPANELNEQIGDDVITFKTDSSNPEALRYQSPTPFKSQVLLYKSKKDKDAFYVNFMVDLEKLQAQKAGDYRGKLRYIFRQKDAEKVELFDLEVQVIPIFELIVDFPPEGAHFRNLLPSSPPQTKEVIAKIKSNLGKPYMVIQRINSPLVNENGSEFDPKFFNMKVEPLSGQSGKIVCGEYSPVPEGEMPIYYSDDRGSAAQFKILYRLTPHQDIDPGNYSTSLMYSLGAM